jgi:hypothetical protein
MPDLMARMGHASSRAAQIYLHTTSERDRVVADALDALLQTRETAHGGHAAVSPLSRLGQETTKAPEFGTLRMERVTGIEPALSAWENHRPMTRRRRKPGILRTPTILTRPSLTANDRSSPTCIARQSHGP